MRKTLILLVMLVFALGSANVLLSQNKVDEKFQKTVDDYFDALWKFYPSAATAAGFHKYDDKLEDLDDGDIEKRHGQLDELNQALVSEVSKVDLSPELQTEHEMLMNLLDLELVKHEMLLPWAYNPLFYNQIIDNALRGLMTSETANQAELGKNAEKRLKDMLKLLKQARENLDTPPQLYTETAIKQFPGILAFYQNDLPGLIDQKGGSSAAKAKEALNKLMPELQAYQTYLSNELLPKSTGNFRLTTAHNRMMRATLLNDIPVQELAARQKADVNNIRREMLLVCIPFYKIMDPEFNVEQPPSNLTEEQVKNVVIAHVLDKIKNDHISKEEFLQALQRGKDEIKAFIQEKGLIDLPDADFEFAEMPVEAQGLTWTSLVGPVPYATGGGYTLQVAPFGNSGDEAVIDSLLQEYNNYYLPFYIARKIYPGCFVPTVATAAGATLIQKFSPNRPLIKGWPVFIEEMLVKAGYGNYDLRLRLNQLKYRLKMAIDFVLDLNIHQGGMTKDQAIAYMTRTGFQSEAEAERNWNRIILNPLDSVYTYAGLQELLDMEKTYRQKQGDSFTKKDFLAKVLSYGTIPIRDMKKKINE